MGDLTKFEVFFGYFRKIIDLNPPLAYNKTR